MKFIPAAEVLAAAEDNDEGKVVFKAYPKLLGIGVGLRLCVDSKDLFTSLSTQNNSIDEYIRGDVGCIRYEF